MKKILLIFLVLLSFSAFGKMEFVPVKAEGTGATKADAISDALQSAVSQVNGAEIAAESSKSIAETFKSLNDQQNISLTEEYQKDIQTKTKGVIRQYSILSETAPNEDFSLWKLTLNVTVAKYELSKQAERLRMAVLPFKVSSMAKDQQRSSEFAYSLKNTLTAYLTQTRKFAMLDRDFQEEQSNELNLIQGSNFRTEELARLGNQLGTDYLVTGFVDDVRQVSSTITMKSTGKKMTTVESIVEMSYRIFDVATGLIKSAGTYSKNISGSKNIIDLAKEASNKIGQEILNAVYPIRIVSINGDLLTLGQGGATIKEGESYKLIQYGQPITDPYTGESLGYDEIEVGVVTIKSVQAKTSKAQVRESSIDLSHPSSALIVRPIPIKYESKQAVVKKVVNQTKKAIKKDIDEFEMDDSW